MWLLIAFLMNPAEFPNQPASIVLSVQPTLELCEQMKVEAMKVAAEKYTMKYPLNFRLACKKEEMKP